jgi:hypothetical protein
MKDGKPNNVQNTDQGPLHVQTSHYLTTYNDPLDIRFAGHIEEDIDEFINALEEDTREREGNMEHLKLRIVRHLARHIRIQLLQELRKAETWDDVKILLRREYSWSMRQPQVWEALSETRQTESTSAIQLLDVMMPLIDRVRPWVSEDQRIAMIIKALRGPLKHAVNGKEYKSFKEFVDYLLKMEKRFNDIAKAREEYFCGGGK